jgi:hypothetical protein
VLVLQAPKSFGCIRRDIDDGDCRLIAKKELEIVTGWSFVIDNEHPQADGVRL